MGDDIAGVAMAGIDQKVHAGKVLVAEDEQFLLNLVASVLSRAGYDVLAAADGEHARHLFEDYAPDLALIIVDIAMPKVTGSDFIARLPTLTPRIPVLFITRFGEHEVEQKLPGDLPVLYKPFTPRQLIQAIDTLNSQLRES